MKTLLTGRNSWSLLGALSLAWLSTVRTVAAELVLLGTHPTSPLTAYPTIHTLKAFDGKIYMGYGDWNFFPAVVVASFDPANYAFHLEFSANTDSIGIFREVGGVLYVPSMDPALYADSHDYSYRAGGVWRDSKPIGMLHIFDMGSVDGSDLWLVGRQYTNQTDFGAVVFRSPDGGRNWQDLTITSALAEARYNWGFPLRGKFYVRDTYYEGTNGTRTAAAPYVYVNRATPIGSGASEFIVAVTGWVPGIGAPVTRPLVTFDTQTWRTLRAQVYHFTTSGSNLFTLEYNAPANALWMASSVTPSQAVWQRLNFNNVPSNAKAIEVLDGVIYVADTQGQLWAGRLDGAAITPPPATVVNELSDDFGRALSFDGDILAIGAPDHSGAVPLCGQVTIWESQGGAWTRTAILDPFEPSFSGWFGKYLVLKGDLLAVIEAGRDLSRADRGSSAQVHVFQRVGQDWAWQQSLDHPYAQCVAVDSGWLAVGAGGTNNATNSLHLYSISGGPGGLALTLHADIAVQPHLSLAPENFWRPTARVSLEGDLCAFGAVGDSDFSGGPGEVQVYRRDEFDVWQLDQLLQSPSPTPAGLALPPDRFGFSLALQDGWLAVAAPRDDTVAAQAGAVHLYERTNSPGGASFVLRQSLYSPVVQAEAAFGNSVALKGSTLLVGCPGVELNGQRQHGAVFVFKREANAWHKVAEVLRPPDSAGEFGATVAFGSNWLAASSRFAHVSGNLADRVAIWRFGPPEGELSAPRRLSKGEFTVIAAGELGRTYHFQTATDLVARNWTDLFPFTLTTPTTNLLDTTAGTGLPKFYRLVSDTKNDAP